MRTWSNKIFCVENLIFWVKIDHFCCLKKSSVSHFFFLQSNKSVTENKPIEKNYCDAVVNFLLRIACQVETPQ